ncbi:PssE/Cps14G family polysaccharide biosynthesis glycosyltransferase [Pontibacter oryzae]|uniref:Glycosyl transferase family 28 n=1 Tax=Pontibacter oryzae TaxID=2304593 RepID=A0A399SEI6_9BACT|nr:PssE/Cps14G family polysaccharide biosynthesis glycosyltransferase [Pontibacter oryzae]RIJ42060.1 glycosyl transferase family 28 [Pontibacter oryzae]
MIFVTTGTQEPFDRLIKAMDEIACSLQETEVVAQVAASEFQPKNMAAHKFLPPKEFNELFNKADLIVSHAGMGTIISALVKQKPIVVLPRLAKFSEHRNDHQLATARAFEKLEYVHAAYSLEELRVKLQQLTLKEPGELHRIGQYASKELINSLQNFIVS